MSRPTIRQPASNASKRAAAKRNRSRAHIDKTTGPTQRQLRAGELVRHALAEIFRGEAVADPALAGVSVTVTEVRMSPDFKHAICFVEPLGAGMSGAEVNGQAGAPDVVEIIAGLNRAAKFLRGRLGHAIELRATPELKFVHDPSFEQAARMNLLFSKPEVRRDLDAGTTDEAE